MLSKKSSGKSGGFLSPYLTLADEPTGNLDSQNEQVVVELLCKLAHEENYAVIIVTHNEAVAAAADVVYGMSDGMLTVVRGEIQA